MATALHVDLLRKLASKVRERKQTHMEAMAKGKSYDEYNRLVGRAQECDALLSEVEATLKQSDEDEGDADEPQGRSRRHRAT